MPSPRPFATLLILCLAFALLAHTLTSAMRAAGSRALGVRASTDTLKPKSVVVLLQRGGQSPSLAGAVLEADFALLSIDLAVWPGQDPAKPADTAARIAALAAELGHHYGIRPDNRPVLAAGPEAAAEALALAAGEPRFHALLTSDLCPGFLGAGAGLSSLAEFRLPWYDFEPRSPTCVAGQQAWLARFPGLQVTNVDGAPAQTPELPALLQWLDPSLGPQAGVGGLAGLPLIETAAKGPGGPRWVLFLSGDGGWAELDRGLADRLAARGIPVVGWDSLSYYWRARKPEDAAADLARIIGHYAGLWRKPRVLLIGYSFGADVLPFLVNRLPAETKTQVEGLVLLGLSPRASFEFHLGDWLGTNTQEGPLTGPELARLTSTPLLCIAGEDDDESQCPPLGPNGTSLRLPGDHHFDGDYGRLVAAIEAHFSAP